MKKIIIALVIGALFVTVIPINSIGSSIIWDLSERMLPAGLDRQIEENIHGNYVVWQDSRNIGPANTWDIYLHDYWKVGPNFPICTFASDQICPAVYDGRPGTVSTIAWTDYRIPGVAALFIDQNVGAGWIYAPNGCLVAGNVNCYNVDIHTRNIVWDDGNGIFLYDMGPNMIFGDLDDVGWSGLIPGSLGGILPAIDGRYIVWQDASAVPNVLRYYDLGPDRIYGTPDDLGTITPPFGVGNNPTSGIHPEISVVLIVFEDMGNIWIYDISTGTFSMQVGSGTACWPDIFMNTQLPVPPPGFYIYIIVWEEWFFGIPQVHFELGPPTGGAGPWDLNPTIAQQNPHIHDFQVVWEEARDAGMDIYSGGSMVWGLQERYFSAGPSQQAEENINGDYVVWQDNRNGNWDIYLYDYQPPLSTWKLNIPICTNGAMQILPAVFDGRPNMVSTVAWTDYRNGIATDIYIDQNAGLGWIYAAVNGFRVTPFSGNYFNVDVYKWNIIWDDGTLLHIYDMGLDMLIGTPDDRGWFVMTLPNPLGVTLTAIDGRFIAIQDTTPSIWIYDLGPDEIFLTADDPPWPLNPLMIEPTGQHPEISNGMVVYEKAGTIWSGENIGPSTWITLPQIVGPSTYDWPDVYYRPNSAIPFIDFLIVCVDVGANPNQIWFLELTPAGITNTGFWCPNPTYIQTNPHIDGKTVQRPAYRVVWEDSHNGGDIYD